MDACDVAPFLSDLLQAEVTDLEPLKGGEWSQAFGFRCEGRELVVRLGQHRDDFEKDQAAFAFNEARLPVPEVLGIGPAPQGHYCISQRIRGEMIDYLDAEGWRRMVPSVLQTLDALREADPSPWVARFGKPTSTTADILLSVDEENDRVFGWHDALTAQGFRELYEKALTYLGDHPPDCPDIHHIVHNDLLHFNVLASNAKITGVFDWGCAWLGDFVYELAKFSFYAPYFPAMAGIDWAAEAGHHYKEIGLDVPNFRERLLCYEIHIGLDDIAYSAFKGYWDHVEWKCKRIGELLAVNSIRHNQSRPI